MLNKKQIRIKGNYIAIFLNRNKFAEGGVIFKNLN